MAAEKHLIKGIDNTCDAARALARRAEENGVGWRKPPAIRGIDNDREAVRVSVVRAERNDRTPSPLGGAAPNDTFEVVRERPAPRTGKSVAARERAALSSVGYCPSTLSREP